MVFVYGYFIKVRLFVGFLKEKSEKHLSEDETRRTWRTPSISDSLMRISSHGRASKRGRKTLCNVCVEAILRVLVIANRDRAVYVERAHISTTHDDEETRVHAICIHDVSTCDYVSLSHDAFSASASRFFNSRDIYYTNDFFRKWRQIKLRTSLVFAKPISLRWETIPDFRAFGWRSRISKSRK